MTKVNISRLRTGLLLGLLAAGAVPAHAQRRPVRHTPDPDVITMPARHLDHEVAPLPGPATSSPLRYPAGRLRDLRDQRDLQYTYAGEAEPEGRSWFWRVLDWILRSIFQMRSTEGGRVTTNIIFYTLAGGAVVFAVLKLLQVDFSGLFGRTRRALPLEYETGTENIHELNFDDALTQAEAAGNLRLAVRLGYLQLLKQLTDRNFIDWQPDKTNQTYLRELATTRAALRAPFTELTRQFEYVWYGEWPLWPGGYRRLRDAQQQFSRQLGRGVAA